MKILKNTVCFLACLCFTFNIILIIIGVFTVDRLLNPKYFISKFETFAFYREISDNSLKSLGNLSRVVNIPKDIFIPFTDEQWIKEEANNYFESFFQYMIMKTEKIYSINSLEQEQSFESNMDSYLKSNNVIVDSAAKQEIERVKKEAVQISNNNITLLDIGNLQAISGLQGIRRVLNAVNSYSWHYLLFNMIALTLILLCSRKKILNTLLWICYSFMTAGILTVLMALAAERLGFSSVISLIEAGILKDILASVVQDLRIYFLKAGTVMTIAAFVVALLSYFKICKAEGNINMKTAVSNPVER